MLTDAALKHLKGKDKIYKVTDRDGMYVLVKPSGTLSFRLDYRMNGRRETVTFGKYGPAGLSLARARELCIDAKRANLRRFTTSPSRRSAKLADRRSISLAMTPTFFHCPTRHGSTAPTLRTS